MHAVQSMQDHMCWDRMLACLMRGNQLVGFETTAPGSLALKRVGSLRKHKAADAALTVCTAACDTAAGPPAKRHR
jgi:hypothetical protein